MKREMELKFFGLGTTHQILIYGNGNLEVLKEKITGRINKIEEHMSAFQENRDVCQMVRHAGKKYQSIHEDTMKVLERAAYFHQLSNGSFDITIRPLVKLWGVGKKGMFIPQKDEIQMAKKMVDGKKVVLKPETSEAILEEEGMELDLGGIAKGYAADEVKRILIENGVTCAMINLGGNVLVFGEREPGKKWRIGIQNPFGVRGDHFGYLDLSQGTIVTSGVNEQFFIKDGERYHHLIDPTTGYPGKSGLMSVTVVCDSSMDADAITTALFILGYEKGMRFLEQVNAECIFVENSGRILMTEGLDGQFYMNA